MCIICLEYQQGKMTIHQAASNLGELLDADQVTGMHALELIAELREDMEEAEKRQEELELQEHCDQATD